MTHVTNVAEQELDRIYDDHREKSAILFSPYQTRAVLDPRDPRRSGSKKVFSIRFFTRNRRFYSYYTRPARFSTHEIREGPVRKMYSPFAFSTTQNLDDACHKRR